MKFYEDAAWITDCKYIYSYKELSEQQEVTCLS